MVNTAKRWLALVGVASLFIVNTVFADTNTLSIPCTNTWDYITYANGYAATNLPGWNAGPDDQSMITNMSYTFTASCGLPLTNATKTQVLQLNTQDSILTNQTISKASETSPVYLDTMVQFVPSASTPSLISGASDVGVKVAVFANSSSNLVVYHGWLANSQWYWASNGLSVFTNWVLNSTNWYRLTVVFDGSVNDNFNTFPCVKVMLNGTTLVSQDAYTDNDKTNYANGTYPSSTSAGGTWFMTGIDNQHDVPAKVMDVLGVGFQGTGYIDDFVMNVGLPAFPPANYFIYQTIGANGWADNPATTISVTAGSSTTITYYASNWYQIASLTTNGVTVAGAAGLTNFPLTLSAISGNISNNISFVRPQYTVALSPVNGTASGVTNINNGDYATNIFIGTQWYVAQSVSGAGTVTAGGVGYTNVTITAGPVTNNISEGVIFYRPQYTVALNPVNGTASGVTNIPNGAYATNTFIGTQWYLASSVTGAGTVTLGGVGYTNVTITAGPVTNSISEDVTFTRPNYSIAISAVNGTVSGVTNIPNGAYATNTFIGTQWYLAQSISGAGSLAAGGIGSSNVTLTAGPVTNNLLSELVTFTRPTWTIAQTIGLHVSGSAGSNSLSILNGASTSVTYTAVSDWYTVTATPGLYGSVSGSGQSQTLTFTTVQTNTTAAASATEIGPVVSQVPNSWLMDNGVSAAFAAASNSICQSGYMLDLSPLQPLAPALSITAVSVNPVSGTLTVQLQNNSTNVDTLTINGTLRLYGTTNAAVAFTEVASSAVSNAVFGAAGSSQLTFSNIDPTSLYQAEITLP